MSERPTPRWNPPAVAGGIMVFVAVPVMVYTAMIPLADPVSSYHFLAMGAWLLGFLLCVGGLWRRPRWQTVPGLALGCLPFLVALFVAGVYLYVFLGFAFGQLPLG